MTDNFDKAGNDCRPIAIVIPPDYTNYSRDRRRMSTDNDVMRQFQKDFAEAPSLQQTKAAQTGSQSTIQCPQCKRDVNVNKKTNTTCFSRFGRICPGSRKQWNVNVGLECPNCGAHIEG